MNKRLKKKLKKGYFTLPKHPYYDLFGATPYTYYEGLQRNKRSLVWNKEFKKYGFMSMETWSLDGTFMKMIYERINYVNQREPKEEYKEILAFYSRKIIEIDMYEYSRDESNQLLMEKVGNLPINRPKRLGVEYKVLPKHELISELGYDYYGLVEDEHKVMSELYEKGFCEQEVDYLGFYLLAGFYERLIKLVEVTNSDPNTNKRVINGKEMSFGEIYELGINEIKGFLEGEEEDASSIYKLINEMIIKGLLWW